MRSKEVREEGEGRRSNPFDIADATAWLSLSGVSDSGSWHTSHDPAGDEYLQQLARLARLVDRLQEVADW
jgi:hypothetical protein